MAAATSQSASRGAAARGRRKSAARKTSIFQTVTGDPQLWVAAFIMQQDTARNSPITSHLVSIADIEKRSGFQFLRELPASSPALSS